ncbi:Tn3 family transposase [Kitasatospora aureofaciens]|uniref:Tn3 family transposase n=1 Tax=Kitasatospora aureofaciens TaxID=1894 RepID=UPI0037CC61E9
MTICAAGTAFWPRRRAGASWPDRPHRLGRPRLLAPGPGGRLGHRAVRAPTTKVGARTPVCPVQRALVDLLVSSPIQLSSVRRGVRLDGDRRWSLAAYRLHDPPPCAARLWRFDLAVDYGPLEPVSRQPIQAGRIREHWEDMLRVAGSLQTGKVRAYDLLRMMTSGDRMTGLGDAFAH